MPFVGMEPSKIKLSTKYLVLRVCLWPSFYIEISGAGSKLSMSKGAKKTLPARPHHRIAQSHHQIPVC